jgi:hypothetical protein
VRGEGRAVAMAELLPTLQSGALQIELDERGTESRGRLDDVWTTTRGKLLHDLQTKKWTTSIGSLDDIKGKIE